MLPVWIYKYKKLDAILKMYMIKTNIKSKERQKTTKRSNKIIAYTICKIKRCGA